MRWLAFWVNFRTLSSSLTVCQLSHQLLNESMRAERFKVERGQQRLRSTKDCGSGTRSRAPKRSPLSAWARSGAGGWIAYNFSANTTKLRAIRAYFVPATGGFRLKKPKDYELLLCAMRSNKSTPICSSKLGRSIITQFSRRVSPSRRHQSATRMVMGWLVAGAPR